MINLNILKEKLKQLGISPDMYCLTGGLPNECYCISSEDNKWEVYYSERGKKTGLKIFNNEHDACQYFFTILNKRKI